MEKPKLFPIYQDGVLVNRRDFMLLNAQNVLHGLVRASLATFEVGALVVNHIVESAQQ